MTKERFLSVFQAYAFRKLGCEAKSAKEYARYIQALNAHAMKLGHPDYLEWIAECSRWDCIKIYIHMLENSIASITAASTRSNYKSALRHLDRFTDEILYQNRDWPQFGKDKSLNKVIRYDEKANKNEYVFDLCVDLKNEYNRVVDFAKHIFSSLFDEDVYACIPVILNPDKPVSYCQATDEYLDKLSEKRERQDTTEEEYEILDEGVIPCSVLAEFYRKPEPKIVIYYQNTCANSRDDYLAILKNALAHEYMHYLHYCYCDTIGDMSTFDDESIREGIAEFFAMLFSLYRDSVSDWYFSEQKYWNWAKMWGSGWPYANVLYLYRSHGKENFYTERIWDFKDNGCIAKMLDVLKKSADFADAYKIFKS